MDNHIKYILKLPKADVKVFDLLIKEREIDTKEEFDTEYLAEELDLNLTTVQRAVKRLYESELIFQNKINLTGGGYKYIYSAYSTVQLVTIIEEKVNQFKTNAVWALENSDEY